MNGELIRNYDLCLSHSLIELQGDEYSSLHYIFVMEDREFGHTQTKYSRVFLRKVYSDDAIMDIAGDSNI